MSIRGDQPIPCYRQADCAHAWGGKTYCDPGLEQCTCGGGSGSGSGSSSPGWPPPPPAPTTPTTPTTATSLETSWREAAAAMWNNLRNFDSLQVPGNADPSATAKMIYIFFGTSYRAEITGVVLLVFALLLSLL